MPESSTYTWRSGRRSEMDVRRVEHLELVFDANAPDMVAATR